MKKGLFKDFLNILPVGIREDGKIYRNFELFPFTTKHERLMQEEISKKKGINQSGVAMKLLLLLIEKIGRYVFPDETLSTKNQVLRLLNSSDFLTVWANLRIENMGNIWAVKITCPRCGEEFVYEMDLLEADFQYWDDEDPLIKEVTLKKGFDFRDTKIKGVGLSLPDWGSLVDLKNANDSYNTKHNIIRSSIQYLISDEGIKDVKGIAIPQDIFDLIPKGDLELISKSMGESYAGIDWRVSLRCPSCMLCFNRPIDWTYDNFFTYSSD